MSYAEEQDSFADGYGQGRADQHQINNVEVGQLIQAEGITPWTFFAGCALISIRMEATMLRGKFDERTFEPDIALLAAMQADKMEAERKRREEGD